MSNAAIHYQDQLSQLIDGGAIFTQIRIAILEVLKQANQPLTAKQIHQSLKDQKISAHRATVYRDIEWCENNKLISKYAFRHSPSLHYELVTDYHHHFVCELCGQIQLLRPKQINSAITEYTHQIERERNVATTANHLAVYGTCKECLSSESDIS